ncbi:hypothetical protein GCM10023194_63570 [Planotetraspora phitsanulokensis]|uniref:DUF6745 domain-containing protein n=1 Tax=Planotetraspora phitsanulokensis TaxID=575192 RepID=A0A8J3U399_9ACTN|nr:hypothetical protein Pph01_24240 [Planotetraspora phitsanulokensis]
MQREAAEIREEWLGRALSTLPADRTAAEAAISGLYRLIGLDPPRFHWVPSPVAALTTVPPGMPSWPAEHIGRAPGWTLPPRFSASMRQLCLDLDARIHPSVSGLIRQEVRDPLSRSSGSSLLMALRAAHDVEYHATNTWYQTQCVSWVAHYDAVRRAAGAVFTSEQLRRLDLWAAVARSCGWWWPRQTVCVISERPVTVRTEVWGDNGEVRLHSADGPAIRYPDGWDVHAWHGTRVPSWVFTDPSVLRIDREVNVEVRRCAIERIGWGSYIGQAGLRLVASAPDPGNPGSELRLYDLRRETRVLLAINGSVERDGVRRQYGLTVPASFDDPVAAAGWTYGLSADQYSLLVRRT